MSQDRTILVVDEEKNIRLTTVHALAASGFHVESAITGEEALLLLRASPYDLVVLDLGLRGLGGLEVLRRIRQRWPGVHVVVTTAHGTVEDAVLAMKLGVADFLQKPYTAREICALATRVFSPLPEPEHAADYTYCLHQARGAIAQHQVATAMAYLRQAVGLEPDRPEAFNLLGAAVYLDGQRYQAQAYFRAAIALDATYRPAHDNLERSVGNPLDEGHPGLSLGRDAAEAE